jgi:predicted phosphodiesterase
MKIALLADIHAHWIGYQAVIQAVEAWQPDLTIVAGDIVNRGPRPARCLEFTLEMAARRGWLVLRGNHEDYVIHQGTAEAARSGPSFAVHYASYWTYEQLGCQTSLLQALPTQLEFALPSTLGADGSRVIIAHGSLLGPRDGIYPETSDAHLASKIGMTGMQRSPLSLFGCGHTHRPLVRHYQGALVVNAGSAGLPFDGDNRPSWAQIEWQAGGWQAHIQRVAYDHQAALHDMHASGYLAQAGPLAGLVYEELACAASRLFSWANHYQERILQGQISMSESVDMFRREMAQLGGSI